MAYYNRKHLLYQTLRTIIQNTAPELKELFEVIIVDDGSDGDHILNSEELLKFNLNLQLVSIKKSEKQWVSNCVPTNIAFEHSQGEIIILQNPECLHAGYIIKCVLNELKENQYWAFGCYTANEEQTTKLQQLIDVSPKALVKALHPMNPQWYCHTYYRAAPYHFLATMYRKHFEEMGGFDERYAQGVAYEDDEFLLRLRRKGLDIAIIDNPFCIHQCHPNVNQNQPNGKLYTQRNRELFHNITCKEDTWKVNNNAIP